MHEPFLRLLCVRLAKTRATAHPRFAGRFAEVAVIDSDAPQATIKTTGTDTRQAARRTLSRRSRLGLAAWWQEHMSTRRLRRDVPRLALNQTEAAEALGMSVDAFEEHVKPHVPCVYAGSRRLYPVPGLQKWLVEESTRTGRQVA